MGSRTTTEVQKTFDLNSPVEKGVLADIAAIKPEVFRVPKTYSGLDEFDEPHSETEIRASSSFNAYLSESQVKDFKAGAVLVATRSGRWATLADMGEGMDGFKSVCMLKPAMGGKPEMRSKSSFEIRNHESFKLSVV